MKDVKEVEKHLPHNGIRPRFAMKIDASPEEITRRIEERLKMEKVSCVGKVLKGHYAHISPLVAEQHFWSPQLSISVYKSHEGKTVLSGLYGPRANVWTLFVFLYFAIAFAAIVVSVLGFANISLEKSGNILYLLPVLGIAFLLLYVGAHFGQKLGHDQMIELHAFLEEALGFDIVHDEEAHF